MSDFYHAISQARKLAETPEGRQLVQMLQQLGGTDLQTAIDSAAAGDFQQAQQVISALMQNPDAKQLLGKLGGGNGK